jgi:hypothetical protein
MSDQDEYLAEILAKLANIVEKIPTTDVNSSLLSSTITNTGLLAGILRHLGVIRTDVAELRAWAGRQGG